MYKLLHLFTIVLVQIQDTVLLLYLVYRSKFKKEMFYDSCLYIYAAYSKNILFDILISVAADYRLTFHYIYFHIKFIALWYSFCHWYGFIILWILSKYIWQLRSVWYIVGHFTVASFFPMPLKSKMYFTDSYDFH